MPALIFVYGTLKSGHCRESALASERYVGTAITAPKYLLYDVGTYPGMVSVEETKCSSGKKVYGELYEISEDCLDSLDVIEGVKFGLYRRDLISLEDISVVSLPLSQEAFDDLRRKRAQAYLYNRDVGGLKECGVFWSSR